MRSVVSEECCCFSCWQWLWTQCAYGQASTVRTHMLMHVFYILRKQRHSLFPQNHLLLSLRNDVSSSRNEIDICIDICLHVWCVFTTFMKIHHKNCLFFSFVRRYKKGSCSTGWTYVLHISELCNHVGSLSSRTLSVTGADLLFNVKSIALPDFVLEKLLKQVNGWIFSCIPIRDR